MENAWRLGSFSSIVETVRDLFAQRTVGGDIWIALAWCVGILLVAYVFAMVVYS